MAAPQKQIGHDDRDHFLRWFHEQIRGEPATQITYIHDYHQIVFHEYTISIYCPWELSRESVAGVQLHELVGKTIDGCRWSKEEPEHLVFDFSGSHALSLYLNLLADSPEAVLINSRFEQSVSFIFFPDGSLA